MHIHWRDMASSMGNTSLGKEDSSVRAEDIIYAVRTKDSCQLGACPKCYGSIRTDVWAWHRAGRRPHVVSALCCLPITQMRRVRDQQKQRKYRTMEIKK